MLFMTRLCCGIMFLICSTTLRAQEERSSDIFRRDATESWQNAKEIYSSPVRYGGSQWLWVTGVISVTAVSTRLDEPLREWSLSHPNKTASTIFSVGELYGNPITAGVIGGGLYLGGLSSKDDPTRLAGRAVLESVLYATVVTQILKMTIGRNRPFANRGSKDIHGLSWTNERWSFPSGHSTIAFATSTALATRLKNPVSTVGLVLLALMTNFNRIYDDKHWLSDTVLGSAIGITIGLAVGKQIDDDLAPRPSSQVSVQVQPLFLIQIPL
jgi:hypothetical protein